MGRRSLRFLSVFSLILVVMACFLLWRSYLVRDELSFFQRSKLIIASDSGLLQFASATCSLGTVVYKSHGITLKDAGPSTYSPTMEWSWANMPAHTSSMTLDRVGVQHGDFYTYGPPFSDGDMSARTLIHHYFSFTIPIAVLPFIFAILPSIWIVKRIQSKPASFKQTSQRNANDVL